MRRTFDTSADQDAALAWRAAQLKMSEDALIALYVSPALIELVKAFLDAEGSRVFEAFKASDDKTRADVRAALKLDG